MMAVELLVAFFQHAMPSLAPPTAGGRSSIIVTLFEGEPYTLWNIRDLARHCGLQVERSFAFQASAYPGYKHARTLGVVKGRDGEVGAGWKGEERSSRTYMFVKKEENDVGGGPKGKKRKGDESSSSEDEDEVEDEDTSTALVDHDLEAGSPEDENDQDALEDRVSDSPSDS